MVKPFWVYVPTHNHQVAKMVHILVYCPAWDPNQVQDNEFRHLMKEKEKNEHACHVFKHAFRQSMGLRVA
jgi:hypothetical protein